MISKEKNLRFSLIQKILKKGDTRNQTELIERLKKKGINVSHATIARDLKELVYIRAPIADGSYRIINVEGKKERIDIIFEIGMMELISVGNIIIIKTMPGNAHAVGGAIDRAQFDGILGTVGGDDTIFAITENKSVARRVIKNLRKYIK